jgi:dCTP deaminase
MDAIPSDKGVLIDRHLRTLIKDGAIRSFPLESIQPASLDLSVLNTVWHVAGVPSMGEEGGFSFQSFVSRFSFNAHNLLNGSATLVPGNVYIAELQGDYFLPEGVYGHSSPKSSTGRIDVHCTLIAEGGTTFNTVPEGYRGRLYVVIVPQSFPIVLTQGISLVQLRLFHGKRRLLKEADVREEQARNGIVQGNGEPVIRKHNIVLHLDLKGQPANLIAQRTLKPIDLRRRDQNPHDYFFEKAFHDNVLFLEPDQFLMATTIERVRIPTNMTGEMIAYDEEYGEIRTHYAGFFDPGFGFGATGEITDSGVVCEIRNMGKAPIMLAHGQAIGLFRYEYTSEKPDTVYGQAGLGTASNYQKQQGVRLAKFFATW